MFFKKKNGNKKSVKDVLTVSAQEYSDLKNSKELAETQLRSLESERDELIEKNDELLGSVHDYEKKCNELTASVQKLEEAKNSFINEKNPEILKDLVKDIKVQQLESLCSSLQEDLKKTKTELEDIEDELDDCQDDLKSERERLKKKGIEFSELQLRFDKLEKECDSNKTELNSVNVTLAKQKDLLLTKNGALDFVREILSADEIVNANSDIADRFSKIDAVVNYVQGDFRDCVNEFFEKSDDDDFYFNTGLLKWAQVAKKSWLKNKTTVAFVGEFSAGKTSIVNKILSQGGDSISLPVSTKATTAIPTYISASEAKVPSYTFYTPDNKLKRISEKIFKNIDKGMLDEITGVSSLIKYFIMTCSNQNLNNLSILDTPGFTSNDREDSERTIEVINECDALFWVFDVNAGTVNRTSLKIIKEKLNKPLFVIINKTDTKAPNEVDNVENLIRDTFTKEDIHIEEIIRFSQKEDPSIIISALQKVPRTNESNSYIEALRDYGKGLKKILDDKLAEAHREESKAKDKRELMIDNCNTTLKNIQEDCERVYNIPQYKEHFFAGDKFEMLPAEGMEFKNLLEEIYNDLLNKLVEDVDAYAESGQELVDLMNSCGRIEYQQKSIADAVKKLNKLLKAVEV